MTLVRRLVAALIGAVLTFSPAVAGTRRSVPVLAASWLVMDASTGTITAQHNADHGLPPASTEKMVTALVVMEQIGLEERVHISRAAAHAEADRIMWPEGHEFTVEQMLYGMLLESSNGAAIALAERVAGTQESFAALMNIKAVSLGATASHFANPSGLDAPGQVSSAHDLALFGRALLQDPTLARIVQTRAYELAWPTGFIHFHSIDHFLYQYPWAIGVKSGFTSVAGNCLVAAAKRNGRTFIVVLMNAPEVTDQAKALMDQAFAKAGPKIVQAAPQPEVAAPSSDPLASGADLSPAGPLLATDPAARPSGREPSRTGLAIVGVTTLAVGLLRVRERFSR